MSGSSAGASGASSSDSDGIVICSSVVELGLRLTYEEVDELLEMGLCGRGMEEEGLGLLEAAAIKRKEWRSKHGCVTDQLPYMDVKATPSCADSDDSGDGWQVTAKAAQQTYTR